MAIETIINRQSAIAENEADDIELPRQSVYAVCNLRGGIGKTTLSFNLSYLADDLLAVPKQNVHETAFSITERNFRFPHRYHNLLVSEKILHPLYS